MLVLFNDPVDMFAMFMKPVVTEFILNPQKQKHTTRQTDSKAGYIDEGEDFVPSDVPQAEFKIMDKHDGLPAKEIAKKTGKEMKNLSPVPDGGKPAAAVLINPAILFSKIFHGTGPDFRRN